MKYSYIDRRIKKVSIEDWFENADYFSNLELNTIYKETSKERWWLEKHPPKAGKYYFITESHLITLIYELSGFFFPQNDALLKRILVASRDGIKEYNLLEEKISKSKTQDQEKLLFIYNNLIPNFSKSQTKTHKSFEDNIIIAPKDSESIISDKYVVFDVETNGLAYGRDDLLSFSFYDPKEGIIYERYLPLEIQPMVLTGHINNIETNVLKNLEPLTQEEIDYLIEKFDLENREILIYCRKGDLFDAKFLFQCMKRHKLTKFELLKFHNFREDLNISKIGQFGSLSKDNLCKLLKIKGVSEIHSASNDVILEWELFKKILNREYILENDALFEIDQNANYIFPLEFVINNKKLRVLKNVKLLNLNPQNVKYIFGENNIIYREYDEKIIGTQTVYREKINLTPKQREKIGNIPRAEFFILLLKKLLKVNVIDNESFFVENTNILGKITSYKNNNFNEKQRNPSDYFTYSDPSVNISKKNSLEYKLKPIIDFINNYIFKNETIFENEIIVSSDNKIFTVCDLSSHSAILDYSSDDRTFIKNNFVKYIEKVNIQAKGRRFYSLIVDTVCSARSVDFEIMELTIIDKNENC